MARGTTMLTHLDNVSRWFWATRAKLSSCNGDHIEPTKPKMFIIQPCLLTPVCIGRILMWCKQKEFIGCFQQIQMIISTRAHSPLTPPLCPLPPSTPCSLLLTGSCSVCSLGRDLPLFIQQSGAGGAMSASFILFCKSLFSSCSLQTCFVYMR